ncbi:MAG: hypothetical protein M1817_006080 [Caeruleum heppii]|nr:MAG: hypothetical protein M1817_006080 [Caeruleum heppii]
MASESAEPVLDRSSLAKVAAAKIQEHEQPGSSPQEPYVPSARMQQAALPAQDGGSLDPNPSEPGKSVDQNQRTEQSDVNIIKEAIKTLQVRGDVASSVAKGSESGVTNTSTSETCSQRPHSTDGKSVASATTFALDEKESLRPDDSASAKAIDEEDTFSPAGSVAAGSRVGSEAGARVFRDQYQELSDRMTMQRGHTVSRVPPVVSAKTISSGDPSTKEANDMAAMAPPPLVEGQTPGVPYGFSQTDPDEKLLEALESPKDRLFLLRLEQDVIDFVKDSKEPLLDLPPCNSFYRLLIHKLADYYFLTHFVDGPASSVRIFRTPFCRLPPPLTGISNPPTSGNTPPPSVQAMKIMRRGMAGKDERKSTSETNTSNNSDQASKANSDDDDQLSSLGGGGSVKAKDKTNMTREEREAAYKEARERIFKGFEESANEDSGAAGEEESKVSRSSSRTGRIKPPNKKHRNPRDDGFEARSQFAPYYGPQYAPPNHAGMAPYNQPSRDSGYSSGHTSETRFMGAPAPFDPSFAAMMPPQPLVQMPTGPQQYMQDNSTTYPQPPPFAYGPPPPMSMQQGAQPFYHPMMPNTSPVGPMGTMPWAQTPYGNTFPSQPQPMSQHRPSPDRSPSAGFQSGAYQFGQFPPQSHASPGGYQHPLPGSFTRYGFNPQTQAFRPGDGSYHTPSQPLHHAPVLPAQYGAPHLPYGMPSQGMNMYPTSGFGSTGAAPISSQPNGQHYGKAPDSFGSRSVAAAAASTPRQQAASTLSKYGSSPNLPPKPPPPTAAAQPNAFGDPQRSLPSRAYAAALKSTAPGHGGAASVQQPPAATPSS